MWFVHRGGGALLCQLVLALSRSAATITLSTCASDVMSLLCCRGCCTLTLRLSWRLCPCSGISPSDGGHGAAMLQALLNMGQAALSLFSFLFLITHLFSSLTPFPPFGVTLYWLSHSQSPPPHSLRSSPTLLFCSFVTSDRSMCETVCIAAFASGILSTVS